MPPRPSSQPLAVSPAQAAAAAAHERHFIRRARERFGLRISAGRYREFCRRVIEVDEAYGIKLFGADERSPTRSCWGGRFGGKLMRVIFDEATERLVTCMPIREEDKDKFPRERWEKILRLRRASRRHSG